MRYASPQALRMALEERLSARARETGVALDRLRRRVVFERVVGRLEAAEPGVWVVKGGMALEVRLHDDARLTKDIDLGLRDDIVTGTELHERVVSALARNLDGDGFTITARAPDRLRADGGGLFTWRLAVTASLAGKEFAGVRLDVSPRAHELDRTDRVQLANLLSFADVPAPVVEIVDVNRHTAEKCHAMFRTYGDRENSRVRDLIDVVLLIEHDQIDPAAVARAALAVWAERDAAAPPRRLPDLPATWPSKFEAFAAQLDLATSTFTEATARLQQLWTDMFPNEEI